MTLSDALNGVRAVFLDSAPIIYFVEAHPRYAPIVRELFQRLEYGGITAVTSPITLAECVTQPIKRGMPEVGSKFANVIVRAQNTRFSEISDVMALTAARLRANHPITLLDALQIAVAIETGCDAFLTNDKRLSRVKEMRMIVVDDFAE
jgi:predicted nucleic acid-binding protein